MDRTHRRILYYVLGFATVTLVYTLLYNWGMATFEGRSQTLWRSFQIVTESFTTTGYGSDSPWTSPVMNGFVTLMQFTGIAMVFTAIPVFLVPLLQEALTGSVPGSAPDATDHVVLCAYTDRGETFLEELEALGVEHVVVVRDRDEATELADAGRRVVHGDYESPEVLRAAGVERARAVVADAGDETNASVVLSAREVAPDVPVTAFAENPDNRRYLEYAGAEDVLLPRELLGVSLAGKVTPTVATELGEAVEIGGDIELAELPVQAGSEVCDRTLAESGIRERTGVNIIGAWFGGRFNPSPAPGDVIDARTILLVAGSESQLDDLKALTLSDHRIHEAGRVIVGGYGRVGSTVCEALESAGQAYTVLDVRDVPAVDVVGDALEETTWHLADIGTADTVILALSDDTSTIFATLVLRELSPDVQVIARADATESVPKLYHAGADYVLALSTVSGRMLASHVLGEDILSLDKQIEIVRTDVGPFAGSTLEDADIRGRTGCTVLAIERDGEVLTDVSASFALQRGDELVVGGMDEAVTEFQALVG